MKQLTVLSLAAVLGATAVIDDSEARRRRDFNNGANYMGLDYQFQQVAQENGEDFSPSSVRFRTGTMYDENFGYEAHLSIGTDSDQVGNTEFEVDNYYGFALRLQAPISEYVAVYGLAGLGWTSFTATTSGGLGTTETSSTESDFVYGGGVAVRFGQQAMLSAEWMSQLSDDDFDITGVNIGIARLF